MFVLSNFNKKQNKSLKKKVKTKKTKKQLAKEKKREEMLATKWTILNATMKKRSTQKVTSTLPQTWAPGTKTKTSLNTAIGKKTNQLNKTLNGASNRKTKEEFTALQVNTTEQKPEPELLTYLKTFKKVDKAKHNLGFYYGALVKEGVESVNQLQDVTTEDLLDLGLSRHRAKKIGKTFAEI